MIKLTKEEKKICDFMCYSRRVNGITIVPLWMSDKAREVEKKLGIKDVFRQEGINYNNIKVKEANEWAKSDV